MLIDRVGNTRDDLLGARVTAIFEDADCERVRDALADCQMGERDGTTTLEVVVRAADGRRLTCEGRLPPSLSSRDSSHSVTADGSAVPELRRKKSKRWLT